MKKSTEYCLIFLLMCGLEVLFWYLALLPGKTFFLRDLSLEIIPKRAFWAHSHGFALWTPYGFFGMPYAANPQSEAFYPFNFFYLLFGAERGLVYYIVFHHLLFLFTFYLALRRLGFGLNASLAASIGFSFGGFMCSLTMLVVLLSTIAWFPLLIICLSLAVEKHWLKYSLLTGPLVALQVLAGEIEIAAMSWALAVLAVGLARKNAAGVRVFGKCLAALALGGLFGALLGLFQLALTLQMIPLSNRAAGMPIEDAVTWGFYYFQLLYMVVPNYLVPPSAFSHDYGVLWGIGYFTQFPYFLSLYLGSTIAVAALAGMVLGWSRKSMWWLALAGCMLVLSMGEELPVYKFLYWAVPGFSFFRFPVKFYFFVNFALAMLAANGMDALGKKSLPRLGWSLLIAGILGAIVLAVSQLRLNELGLQYAIIQSQFFRRCVARTCAYSLAALGIILAANKSNRSWFGLAFAGLCFCDLFFAMRYLNPPVNGDFYKPDYLVSYFLKQNQARKFPVRILPLNKSEADFNISQLTNPLDKFVELKDALDGLMPAYYGINDYRAYSSFHISEIPVFGDLLNATKLKDRRLLLSRAGIEDIFHSGNGFEALALPFPRAMIFYNARFVSDREEVLSLLREPNFPALRTLLLEDGEAQAAALAGPLMSHPAEVARYENERVEIQAEAKRDGWLMLLDTFYPGWTAEVDGRTAAICRANGFFRAVKIPAGKHLVTFNYRPRIFYRALPVSAAGCLVWIGLFLFSLKIGMGKK